MKTKEDFLKLAEEFDGKPAPALAELLETVYDAGRGDSKTLLGDAARALKMYAPGSGIVADLVEASK